MKTIAVVLAAGSGSRMKSGTKKQFMMLGGFPLLYHSLKTFEESFIDGIVLVTGAEDIDFCREEIVDRYGFKKVSSIVPGGAERADSVLCGLRAAGECDYVFIHDGARPLLDEDILMRSYEAVKEYDAAVVGMPSKDTVKIASADGFVESTPPRSLVWTIQTPQVFRYSLIREAYESVLSRVEEYEKKGIRITDDAMVLEAYSGHPVKLVEGSYRNIKVTTPEDIDVAERFLGERP
ncbi:MAG: 2-C-methyl-D-erythritol 4-phosphate cytidylyltransferase [Lachnospiraceae bacterium]|nr:2-C-methyl-D-erythritol 4-phosphate cytidylyltransferase [Lachnospiraceae bacterium]